jgi:nucleolar protein 9
LRIPCDVDPRCLHHQRNQDKEITKKANTMASSLDVGAGANRSFVSGSSRTVEHPRPRRPNTDTLSYLKSLPLELELSNEQVKDFVEYTWRSSGTSGGNGEIFVGAGVEFPNVLGAALSAIEEVKNEVASLAGDEHGAECVELLARVACPHSELASRLLLASVVDYAVHLATHRYGSHVLQTILQLSATSGRSDTQTHKDLALHEESPIRNLWGSQSLPSLMGLLKALQSTLAPCVADLSVHLCGSHVLRSLICVLGGVKPLHHQGPHIHRGKVKSKKKKKHKHDSAALAPSQGGSNLDVTWDPDSRIVETADSRRAARECLEELTKQLTGTDVRPPGQLQEMACHVSAGPLLVILLRVLTWSHALEGDSMKRGGNDGPLAAELTFQPGSPAHLLAQRLLCWKDNASVEEDGQPWATDVIYEYAGKLSGSHVLEAVLRLSHDDFHASVLKAGKFLVPATLQEYVEHNVRNFVVQTALSTVRTAPCAEDILTVVSPLLRSGLILDAEKRRRGVLWRAVEAAATHGVYQKELIQDIVHGFESLRSSCVPPSSSKRIRDLKECVPLLLSIALPEQNGGRLAVNVPGVQCVRSLLSFPPGLCGDTLKGVVRLSIEELEALAKDGLGSRCVWDGILDNPAAQSDENFCSATKKLAGKLQGRWVAIASDRIGQHVVQKLFAALTDIGGRTQLVSELASGKARLNGSAMGRSVMETCFVHEFIAKGEKEWTAMVKKMLHKSTLAKEIFDEVVDQAPVERPDRKRRKAVDEDHQPKRKQKPSTMSVDAIMRTLTIPCSK